MEARRRWSDRSMLNTYDQPARRCARLYSAVRVAAAPSPIEERIHRRACCHQRRPHVHTNARIGRRHTQRWIRRQCATVARPLFVTASEQSRLEDGFRNEEALVAQRDHLAVGQLVKLLKCRCILVHLGLTRANQARARRGEDSNRNNTFETCRDLRVEASKCGRMCVRD